ncbi:hypothetical protein ACQQ9V_04380, partial [Hornefia butyriciproducens]|uniref:hypothetical protein n=1 Tax=Hornefia butyriciproducens TaxID=2652293 RepID=UPI003CFF3438
LCRPERRKSRKLLPTWKHNLSIPSKIKENPKKADCHNGSPLLFAISIFQMHSADCRKVFQMFHPKPFSSMIQKRPNS